MDSTLFSDNAMIYHKATHANRRGGQASLRGQGGVVVTPLAEPHSHAQAVFAAAITVQTVIGSTPTPTLKDNCFFGHF